MNCYMANVRYGIQYDAEHINYFLLGLILYLCEMGDYLVLFVTCYKSYILFTFRSIHCASG